MLVSKYLKGSVATHLHSTVSRGEHSAYQAQQPVSGVLVVYGYRVQEEYHREHHPYDWPSVGEVAMSHWRERTQSTTHAHGAMWGSPTRLMEKKKQ